jgi:hypothetical protein
VKERLTVVDPVILDKVNMDRTVRQVETKLNSLIFTLAKDFEKGNFSLEEMNTEPDTDSIGEGQLVLYDDSGTVKLYTVLEGEVYYVALTKVT